MALAGTSALGVPLPAAAHQMEVVVETARCATDAIASATGCTLGGRTLRVEERGTMAARFREVRTGREVRVAARDESKSLATLWAPESVSRRHAQSIAYRVMPDELLFEVAGVCAAPDDAGGAAGRSRSVSVVPARVRGA